MPVFRKHTAIEIVRNVKAFLNLEAGVIRGRATNSPQDPKLLQQQLQKKNREISRLRRELTQASSSSSAPKPDEEAPPMFFLVGRAKSGTSWLMRLLNSHPEILCRGEGKLFGKDSPKSLHHALANSDDLQTWLNRNPWTWQEQDPKLEHMMSVLVRYLMAEKLSKTRKRIVGDKTPLESNETIEDVADLCPSSKVVHIIRDGRDVAVSTLHHWWREAETKGDLFKLSPQQEARRDAYRADPSAFGSSGESIFSDGQIKRIARDWRDSVEHVRQDGPRLLGDSYYEIYYEDFLTGPIRETQRLLEFLEADASEETSRHCVEATSFEKMASRKPGEEDSTSFFRKGVAGDWRGVFTKEDRQAFEEEAGETLVRLGYEKNNGWAKSLGN